MYWSSKWNFIWKVGCQKCLKTSIVILDQDGNINKHLFIQPYFPDLNPTANLKCIYTYIFACVCKNMHIYKNKYIDIWRWCWLIRWIALNGPKILGELLQDRIELDNIEGGNKAAKGTCKLWDRFQYCSRLGESEYGERHQVKPTFSVIFVTLVRGNNQAKIVERI